MGLEAAADEEGAGQEAKDDADPAAKKRDEADAKVTIDPKVLQYCTFTQKILNNYYLDLSPPF